MKIVKFPGAGISCNNYLLKSGGHDGVFALIDSGCDEKHLLHSLDALGVSPDKVGIVISTHCHFDHVSCNGLFTNAKIMIHSEDAVHVSEKHRTHVLVPVFPKSFTARVDRMLSDGDLIRVGGDELQVIHTPGHTKGSVCILHTGSGTLFSGDTIFAHGSIGRCDLPGGDLHAIKQSIERLRRDYDFDAIHPGHGESTSRDEEFA